MRKSMWMLSVLSVGLATSPLRADDRDGDGLDDQIEAMLLDRHRPTLIFEPDERYAPVSILDLVQHSSLVAYYRYSQFVDCSQSVVRQSVVYTESQLSADPTLLIYGTQGYLPPGNFGRICEIGDTSFASSPSPPLAWRMDINDAFRAPFARPFTFRDIYGHVVPTSDGRILIQYWLLFPMNEAECNSDCGDHEADWLYLDVYVGNAPPYPLQSIVYHHHGDNNCNPITVPYPGLPLPPPLMGWRNPPVDLPVDGHPICYIEEQAHECWPWASGGGECDFTFGTDICQNASHFGGGFTYTVSSVINVGEWYAPMPGDLEAQLFILYNGLWGYWGADCEPFNTATPPDSPMVQSFPSPPGLNYLSHGAPVDAVGSGTPTDPWRSFPTAAAHIGTGQTLRVLSGSYSAVGTWNRAMKIDAALGPVTLGR